jgi:hypothetical protein
VQGQINWHYFDSALQLAHDHRKKVALVVTAGVTSPSWIFNPPTNAEQLTVHDAEGNAMVIPVPWDANFQSVWGNLVQALGARYGSDPAFIYADISGLGREHETVFVSEEDVAPCNAKAQTDGFPSCMAAWTAGAEWGIDLFHAAFPSKSFFFVGAVPSPEQDGIGALYAVVRWGAAKYANFGFKNCGLWPGNAWPPANSPGTLLVQELSASRRPTMYQFHLPIDTYAEMNESLTKGMNNGAIGIEVFATNGDNSIFLPLFDVANTRMLSR